MIFQIYLFEFEIKIEKKNVLKQILHTMLYIINIK